MKIVVVDFSVTCHAHTATGAPHLGVYEDALNKALQADAMLNGNPWRLVQVDHVSSQYPPGVQQTIHNYRAHVQI